MKRIQLVLIMPLLLTIGCVKERIIERQAPANINESFSTEQLCEKTNCLRMKKATMGKIYMLLSSGRSAGSTPQWTDLKPQLVSFERSGDQIALLEENYQSIYEEITGRELIQSFDIVGEDAETLTFNWGHGPKALIYEGPYDVAGPDVGDSQEEEGDLALANRQYLPVVDAYTQNVSIIDGKLHINQIIKIRTQDAKKGNIDESLNMNFQLIPYAPPKNFKVLEADPDRLVGFFVSKLNRKGFSKTQSSLINHWDIERPITVAISKSVPDQYVGALVEGALYWNKVFGKEVIKVVTGFDPASAPMERTIIVRWVPWLDAGAAYAISQSDPLTGEILRGQVFLPTVFTRVGSADLVHSNGGEPTLMSKMAIKCDISKKIQHLNKLGSREVDSSRRLRLAQDSLRSTLAHELGHAIGLRHNFAGSFSSKVTTADVYESIKTYSKNLDHKGLEATTSIMDYVSGIDDILTSAYIKHSALSYDKMAMDYVYSGKASSQSISMFCTDEDISIAAKNGKQIYGCARFDAGNNPLYRSFLDAKDDKDNLVKVLTASILGRAFPADQALPIRNMSEVIAESHVWAQAKMDSLKLAGNVLFDVSKFNTKVSQFESLQKYLDNPLAADNSVDVDLDNAIALNLQEAGGLNNLYRLLAFDGLGKVDTNWLERQLAEIKKSKVFESGDTLGGRAYKLTAEDVLALEEFFNQAAQVNIFTAQQGVVDYLFPTANAGNKSGVNLVLKESVQKQFILTPEFIDNWFVIGAESVEFSVSDRAEVEGVPAIDYIVEIPVPSLPMNLRKSALVFADVVFVGGSATATKAILAKKMTSNLDLIFAVFGYPAAVLNNSLNYEGQLKLLMSQVNLSESLVKYIASEISLLKSLEAIK